MQKIRKNMAVINWYDIDQSVVLDVVSLLSKSTTKVCPKCASMTMIRYRSRNLKVCADCGEEIEWKLDNNQKSY